MLPLEHPNTGTHPHSAFLLTKSGSRVRNIDVMTVATADSSDVNSRPSSMTSRNNTLSNSPDCSSPSFMVSDHNDSGRNYVERGNVPQSSRMDDVFQRNDTPSSRTRRNPSYPNIYGQNTQQYPTPRSGRAGQRHNSDAFLSAVPPMTISSSPNFYPSPSSQSTGAMALTSLPPAAVVGVTSTGIISPTATPTNNGGSHPIQTIIIPSPLPSSELGKVFGQRLGYKSSINCISTASNGIICSSILLAANKQISTVIANHNPHPLNLNYLNYLSARSSRKEEKAKEKAKAREALRMLYNTGDAPTDEAAVGDALASSLASLALRDGAAKAKDKALKKEKEEKEDKDIPPFRALTTTEVLDMYCVDPYADDDTAFPGQSPTASPTPVSAAAGAGAASPSTTPLGPGVIVPSSVTEQRVNPSLVSKGIESSASLTDVELLHASAILQSQLYGFNISCDYRLQAYKPHRELKMLLSCPLVKLHDIAKTFIGTKMLLTYITECGVTALSHVFSEILCFSYDLMLNIYGNVVIQHLIYRSNSFQRVCMLLSIYDRFISLACDNVSSRAIQKLVEAASTDIEHEIILYAIREESLPNHVIRKITDLCEIVKPKSGRSRRRRRRADPPAAGDRAEGAEQDKTHATGAAEHSVDIDHTHTAKPAPIVEEGVFAQGHLSTTAFSSKLAINISPSTPPLTPIASPTNAFLPAQSPSNAILGMRSPSRSMAAHAAASGWGPSSPSSSSDDIPEARAQLLFHVRALQAICRFNKLTPMTCSVDELETPAVMETFEDNVTCASMLRLARNSQGWHILYSILDLFPYTKLLASRVIHLIYHSFSILVMDKYGTVLVKKLLSFCSSKVYGRFAELILGKLDILMVNQYSNYIVQEVIQRSSGQLEVYNQFEVFTNKDNFNKPSNFTNGCVNRDACDLRTIFDSGKVEYQSFLADYKTILNTYGYRSQTIHGTQKDESLALPGSNTGVGNYDVGSLVPVRPLTSSPDTSQLFIDLVQLEMLFRKLAFMRSTGYVFGDYARVMCAVDPAALRKDREGTMSPQPSPSAAKGSFWKTNSPPMEPMRVGTGGMTDALLSGSLHLPCASSAVNTTSAGTPTGYSAISAPSTPSAATQTPQARSLSVHTTNSNTLCYHNVSNPGIRMNAANAVTPFYVVRIPANKYRPTDIVAPLAHPYALVFHTMRSSILTQSFGFDVLHAAYDFTITNAEAIQAAIPMGLPNIDMPPLVSLDFPEPHTLPLPLPLEPLAVGSRPIANMPDVVYLGAGLFIDVNNLPQPFASTVSSGKAICFSAGTSPECHELSAMRVSADNIMNLAAFLPLTLNKLHDIQQYLYRCAMYMYALYPRKPTEHAERDPALVAVTEQNCLGILTYSIGHIALNETVPKTLLLADNSLDAREVASVAQNDDQPPRWFESSDLIDSTLQFDHINIATPVLAATEREAVYMRINEHFLHVLRGLTYDFCIRDYSINVMETCVKHGHAVLKNQVICELVYKEEVYTTLIEHPVGSFMVKHVFHSAQGDEFAYMAEKIRLSFLNMGERHTRRRWMKLLHDRGVDVDDNGQLQCVPPYDHLAVGRLVANNRLMWEQRKQMQGGYGGNMHHLNMPVGSYGVLNTFTSMGGGNNRAHRRSPNRLPYAASTTSDALSDSGSVSTNSTVSSTSVHMGAHGHAQGAKYPMGSGIPGNGYPSAAPTYPPAHTQGMGHGMPATGMTGDYRAADGQANVPLDEPYYHPHAQGSHHHGTPSAPPHGSAGSVGGGYAYGGMGPQHGNTYNPALAPAYGNGYASNIPSNGSLHHGMANTNGLPPVHPSFPPKRNGSHHVHRQMSDHNSYSLPPTSSMQAPHMTQHISGHNQYQHHNNHNNHNNHGHGHGGNNGRNYKNNRNNRNQHAQHRSEASVQYSPQMHNPNANMQQGMSHHAPRHLQAQGLHNMDMPGGLQEMNTNNPSGYSSMHSYHPHQPQQQPGLRGHADLYMYSQGYGDQQQAQYQHQHQHQHLPQQHQHQQHSMHHLNAPSNLPAASTANNNRLPYFSPAMDHQDNTHALHSMHGANGYVANGLAPLGATGLGNPTHHNDSAHHVKGGARDVALGRPGNDLTTVGSGSNGTTNVRSGSGLVLGQELFIPSSPMWPSSTNLLSSSVPSGNFAHTSGNSLLSGTAPLDTNSMFRDFDKGGDYHGNGVASTSTSANTNNTTNSATTGALRGLNTNSNYPSYNTAFLTPPTTSTLNPNSTPYIRNSAYAHSQARSRGDSGLAESVHSGGQEDVRSEAGAGRRRDESPYAGSDMTTHVRLGLEDTLSLTDSDGRSQRYSVQAPLWYNNRHGM